MHYFLKNSSYLVPNLFTNNENDVAFNSEFKFWAAAVIALILVCFTKLQPKIFKLKSTSWIDSLPGPKGLPIIGGLHYFRDLSKTFKILHDWTSLYGPIYRSEGIFNEPIVFLNDASHVQAILSSNHLGLVTKPVRPYDSLFGQFLKNGLLISKASVLGLEVCGNEEGIIFYESLHKYKIISSKRSMNPLLLFDLFWRLHPLSREYNRLINSMNNVTRKIIEKHKEAKKNDAQCRNNNEAIGNDCIMGKKPCRSMMDEMLASDMTPEEILIEINTVIAAGFESTSLTVHYMLFLLALNPEHQRVCQEEIDGVFNDPVRCENGNLTMDAVGDMKYLERCCYETLRIFPVIFMFQRKPEVAVKLDEERVLPPNTTVAISPILMHNNPEHYPEPDKFQPDRFLPENCRKRHPYAYLPFSAGIRNCIGMVELKIL